MPSRVHASDTLTWEGYRSAVAGFAKDEGTSAGQEWRAEYEALRPVDRVSVVKRQMAHVLCNAFRFNRVLEAFAGVGYLTELYARSAREVYAVEQDSNRHALLRYNMRTHSNVRTTCADNLLVMLTASCELRGAFDVVDLDPYGNAYDQLRLAGPLLAERFLLFVTSGEVQAVSRKFWQKDGGGKFLFAYYSKSDLERCSGSGVAQFPDLYLNTVRRLIKRPDVTLYKAVVCPAITMRLVLGVGYPQAHELLSDYPEVIT